MPVEMLTYAELGEKLKISPEAARALVKRQRLPRSRSNDGKTLVQIDLTEISHSPVSRGPQAQAGHQAVTALNQKIETLQAELIEMEAIASGHRADFERECERTNKLLAELLKASAQTTATVEKAALLEGKLSMLTQPWLRRLAMLSPLPFPGRPPSRARASGELPDHQASLGHWRSGGILKVLGNLRDRGTAAARSGLTTKRFRAGNSMADPTAKGGQFVTLKDADTYIAKPAKAERATPEWLNGGRDRVGTDQRRELKARS